MEIKKENITWLENPNPNWKPPKVYKPRVKTFRRFVVPIYNNTTAKEFIKQLKAK